MARYPNISDHGLIGDLQTAALVTTDGTVDWFTALGRPGLSYHGRADGLVPP